MKPDMTALEECEPGALSGQSRSLGLRKVASEARSLPQLLATFEPVTLAQMQAASLMDRSENKFLLARRLLAPALAELRGDYRVLVAAGTTCSRYRTLYFDTDDLALYLRHHAGAADRYKVRTREYVDSGLAFLEVKRKVGPVRTVKSRIPIVEPPPELRGEAAEFVEDACPYPDYGLRPRLWNYCTRLTLVSRRRPERVTLDLALAFAWGEELAVLPGVVVAEVKRQGRRNDSEFIGLMHRYHVRETSFSKYCMGVSLLYPDIKHNRFKAKQRQLARLTGGGNDDIG